MKTIPTSEPEVILFDMDGVLFDTMPAHAVSWYQTAVRYGLEATKEEFYLYEGQKGIDTVAHLYRRQHGKEAPSSLIEEIYNYKTTLFSTETEIKLIPNILSLIKYLKKRNRKVGVVTGSSRQNALGRIEKYFSEYISNEHIITADDCRHGKPHPEPYSKGMELFGTKPERCIVVENAPYGVRSASDADAYVIAVTTGPIPGTTLYTNGADIVLPNMMAVQEWWDKHFDSI